MRSLFIFILSISVVSCSMRKQDKQSYGTRNTERSAIDSCFYGIYIDKLYVESKNFRNFWDVAEKKGYTFVDDTIVPFVKVIFQPASSVYYSDTVELFDCRVFDSVNIHSAVLTSPKSGDNEGLTNVEIQEWSFKNHFAAESYALALTRYHDKGYGVKSPTAVLLLENSVYIFKTAAYKSISEMENMLNLLGVKAKVYVTNY